MMDKKQLLLYAITDCDHYQGEELLRRTEAILANGATILQYRDKHGVARADVEALKVLCHRYGVPFVINDDVDLAIEVDADGVHVGQDDEAAAQARERLGADKIVGVTAKTMAHAEKALSDGADYLGVGALFPSKSKNSSLTSRETLSEICQAMPIPIVGIGGIDADNALALTGTGIAGIAVINALYQFEDPSEATQDLVKKASTIAGKGE